MTHDGVWRWLPVAGLRQALTRGLHNGYLRAIAILLLLFLTLPVLAIIGGVLLLHGSEFLSPATLFYMLLQTLLYVGGVLAVALLLALPAAWAVVMLNFRGRQLAVWLLFLPFALPPYITAYIYDDLLRAAGIYAPPMPVAILATALAVYPYVFFLTRVALQQQHCHIQSAARLLGCSSLAAIFRVSLPLARPAIGIGVVLAAMETLNDIGVAEYFGIETLGVGIYDLWLNRNDVVAGARLALLLTAIVLALVWLEEHARHRRAQYVAACDKCYECERAVALAGGRQVLLWLALLLPIGGGFLLPIGYLLYLSASAAADWQQPLLDGLAGSVSLAAGLVVLLLIIGVFLAVEKRINRRGALMRLLVRLARIVYALPGTVVAQGIFLLAVAIYSVTGLHILVFGSIALLLFAGAARFFIIAGGALEAGIDKIPPQLDAAARLAALSPLACFLRVHLPMLRPAAALAAVLIFLEGIKELPMTLILRPFNFDTLATVVYEYASDEALAAAAPAALTLVALAAAGVTLLFLLEGKQLNRAGGQQLMSD